MKIAIAGGSGQVAREVINALAETERYGLLVLSRSEINEQDSAIPGVVYRTVAYHDKQALTEVLRGVDTVLSFIQILSDVNQMAQKSLIDAALQAGVKRFAPSEYGSCGLEHMDWWNGKDKIRQYLAEINQEETVLEYTLFQPGLFLEYLAFPYRTAKYLQPLQTVFDFNKSRAIIVQAHDDAIMTLTSVTDLAATIVQAVGFQGSWPTTFGIRGNRLTFSQIISIGESVRGKVRANCAGNALKLIGQPFDIESVDIQDLEAGKLVTSWSLEARHAAVSVDEAGEMLKQVAIGILLSCVDGAWDVGDDANKLFPEHVFLKAEDYLAAVWNNQA